MRDVGLFAVVVLAAACARGGGTSSVSPTQAVAAEPSAAVPAYAGGPPIAAFADSIPCVRWEPDPRRQWHCVDRDDDGYTDDVDACPDEPETFNTVDDDDGCPDEGESLIRVDEERGVIELLEPIEFEFDKAVIRPESWPVLDHIAAVLRAYTRFDKVEIQGHDSPRTEHYGRRITDLRAAAVRQALAERGIDLARLESVGYGDTRPIVSNETQEGRRQNRRIELRVRAYGSPR